MVALGRRYFVGGAAALGTTALWPERPSFAISGMGFDEARHLLSRATFGARPAEIRAVAAMDYDAAVDRLLAIWHGDAQYGDPAADARDDARHRLWMLDSGWRYERSI